MPPETARGRCAYIDTCLNGARLSSTLDCGTSNKKKAIYHLFRREEDFRGSASGSDTVCVIPRPLKITGTHIAENREYRRATMRRINATYIHLYLS